MREEDNQISSVIVKALSALLFFGFFIKEDNLFIQGYAKLGKINSLLFGVVLLICIIGVIIPSAVLNMLCAVISIGICIVSFIGVFTCLHQKTLDQTQLFHSLFFQFFTLLSNKD